MVRSRVQYIAWWLLLSWKREISDTNFEIGKTLLTFWLNFTLTMSEAFGCNIGKVFSDLKASIKNSLFCFSSILHK